MTSNCSTFVQIRNSCFSMLCLYLLAVIILWQQLVIAEGKSQGLESGTPIKGHPHSAGFHVMERQRRALDAIQQEAPCYSKGGSGGSSDYGAIQTRSGKSGKGSKLGSLKNKLKKGKFLEDSEQELTVERQRRQAMEETDYQENDDSGLKNKTTKIMDYMKKTWSSIKDSMKNLFQTIGQTFKSEGNSSDPQY